MNNKQLLKATAEAMLADALAGYVSTERLVNYLAQHGWQRRPEEEAAHKYVEMVFTAPITADDGSDIYLVIYQQKTADWLGKPLPIMSALDLVAAVEERSKLAVLLEWLNPAHAEAVRQLLVALEQSEVT
jgi:hypothetical protein